jgi:hypothetical protein
MPDFPLTPRLYGRAHGNLRVAGETCSVCTAGRSLGTSQGANARNRVMTATDGGSRPSNCATFAIKLSGRYLFHSCSRSISLAFRPKVLIQTAAAAPARETLL